MEKNLFRKAIIVVIICFFIGINITPGMEGIIIDHSKNNNKINYICLFFPNNINIQLTF